MLKKIIATASAVFIIAGCMAGCANANTVHSSKDLEDKTIGVQLGTTGEILAADIPSAKIEALENAPPENMFSSDIRPVLVCSRRADKASGLTPGSTTNEPKRYIAAKPRVMRIRVRKSSTLQIFFKVSKNFFIVFRAW